MAYQANIPQATDAMSQSQIDIQNNFGALQTLINVNHVDFASSDQGKHKWVTFPVQGSAPSFAAGELGLYNLAYAPTFTNELFLTNAVGTTYPITASMVNGVNNSGWTYLPSGVIMVWGVGNIIAGGNLAVLYSSVTNFPGFTVGASVPQLTRVSAGTSTAFVTVSGYSNTGFTAYSNTGGNSVIFAWMAIGK
jgi:hypothetical protein